MKLPARLSGWLFTAMLAAGEDSPIRARPVEKPKRWFRNWQFVAFVIFIVCGVVLSVRFAGAVVALVCGGETLLVIGLILFRHISLAARISGLITREQEQGRYDLVRLTGLGEMGAAWVLSHPAFRRDARGRSELRSAKLLRSLASKIAKVLLALLILLSIAGFVDVLSPSPSERLNSLGYIVVALAYPTAIAFAFRYDSEQTLTISALVGMLMPTFVRTALEAQIASIIAFVVLQIGSYLGALYLIMRLFQAYRTPVDRVVGDGILSEPAFNSVLEILMVVIYFLIFYSIREGMVWVLWRWLCKRLRADPAELELAMRVRL